MIRVTIAEPVALPVVLTPENAPLWQDGQGNLYRVASGMYEDCPLDAWVPDPDGLAAPPQASPDATVQIAAMDGLAALAAMGLQPLPDAD
ncbi:hypothetical protein [Roseinatronobacter sp. NSM]|uniref:hypothetical protein n=1 Tax=Roseinatronobacter sp. NSM TaxID=3457785 RepID=UPI004035748F